MSTDAMTRYCNTAFHEFPDPIYIVHSDGTLIDANRAGLELLADELAVWNGVHLSRVLEVPPGEEPIPTSRSPVSGVTDTIAWSWSRPGRASRRGRLRITPLKGPELPPDDAIAVAVWTPDKRSTLEHDLVVEHHRFRSLFDQAHDAVFILDLAGNHLAANQRAADLLGYSIQEIQNKSLTDVSAEPERSHGVLERLLTGERVPPYERVFRTNDGRRVHVEINAETVYDAEGRPLHIQSIVRDITERKRNEETIRDLLADKDLLLREVHHRVKNNLTTLMTMISLESANAYSADVRQSMDTLSSRVRSMLLVYDSLFASAEYTSVRIDLYLEELVDRLRASVTHLQGVAIECRAEAMEVPAGLTFPIGIVVNELVTNALKHAFPGGRSGTVRVEFARRAEETAIIAVTDDGIGLESNQPDSDGTGFGQVMVEALAGKLHGTITRTSDRGTRVEIAAPIASLTGDATTAGSAASRSRSSTREPRPTSAQ